MYLFHWTNWNVSIFFIVNSIIWYDYKSIYRGTNYKVDIENKVRINQIITWESKIIIV